MADSEVLKVIPLAWVQPSDHDWQGASPREQIIEACRRDNVELFQEVLGSMKKKSPQQIADFFNNTTDVLGSYLLHVCATYGSCMHSLPLSARVLS
jgi:hypothetical protein